MKSRTYKLLKWYPGLPKDWVEGTTVKGGPTERDWYYPEDSKITPKGISVEIVENNPLYWGRVDRPNEHDLEVGKRYRILYKHCKSDFRVVIITRITEQGYPWGECPNYSGIITPHEYDIIERLDDNTKNFTAISWEVNSKTFSMVNPKSNGDYIYSEQGSWMSLKDLKNRHTRNHLKCLQRNSDGVFYAVGERIKINGHVHIISKFDVDKDNTAFVKLYDTKDPIDINLLKEPIGPSFIDECDNPIFEGDTYYYIDLNSGSYNIKTAVACDTRLHGVGANNIIKRFKYKEDASEYVLNIKPLFCLDDILTTCSRFMRNPEDDDECIRLFTEKARELIKT